MLQDFTDNVSDGEEAKPNDDENILKLDNNEAESDLLVGVTQTESTNLLAGLDNQMDLLSLQGEGTISQDNQNMNLVDF